jgi:hypothetical protein
VIAAPDAIAEGVAGVAGGNNSTAKGLRESCSQKMLPKIVLGLFPHQGVPQKRLLMLRGQEQHDKTANTVAPFTRCFQQIFDLSFGQGIFRPVIAGNINSIFRSIPRPRLPFMMRLFRWKRRNQLISASCAVLTFVP